MQRNADDNEHPKEQQQDQQRHRDVDRQQVGEQAGGDVANDAARVPESLRLVRTRQPTGDIDQAKQAQCHSAPTDHLPAKRTVTVWMAQCPPGHERQENGCYVAEGADRACDTDEDGMPDSAWQAPPHCGADHDRAAEQKQPDSVAPQRRVDFLHSRPNSSHRASHRVGKPLQEGRDTEEQLIERRRAWLPAPWPAAARPPTGC